MSNGTITAPAMTAAAVVATLPLEFRFNQRELFTMVRLTGNNKIGISICSLPEAGGFRKMYMCAASHKAQTSPTSIPEMETNMRPVIACPFPPRWVDNLEFVTHAELAAAPKFFVDAPVLGATLLNNTPLPEPNGDILVSATLQGGLDGNGDLETFVTFTMMDDKGATTATLKASEK
jgi:hypothetical protein